MRGMNVQQLRKVPDLEHFGGPSFNNIQQVRIDLKQKSEVISCCRANIFLGRAIGAKLAY
jgi:hypothetical protein